MNKITLGKSVIVSGDRTVEFTTLDLLNQLLDQPIDGGLTVADFRARSRVDKVLDLIKASDTELLLNDADFATVQKAVESAKFTTRSGVATVLIDELFPESSGV